MSCDHQTLSTTTDCPVVDRRAGVEGENGLVKVSCEILWEWYFFKGGRLEEGKLVPRESQWWILLALAYYKYTCWL